MIKLLIFTIIVIIAILALPNPYWIPFYVGYGLYGVYKMGRKLIY